MKVLFAGSRSLELNGRVAAHLFAKLHGLYDPARPVTVLLRKPTARPLRPFEALVSSIATALGYEVKTFSPGPGGRAATFSRDVEAVAAADRVIAYFPADDEMEGGTGHVVDKALDQERPCEAYVLDGDEIRLFGSGEGP